ncbi:unnamed protein product, partial [marine sediment metagenome]
MKHKKPVRIAPAQEDKPGGWENFHSPAFIPESILVLP